MQRRKFGREFKVEAVRLISDRGGSVAQAARDLDGHENVLRKWVKEFSADPGQAFPGHGQIKPEQAEIDRLRKEVVRLRAERDIPKNGHRVLRAGRAVRFAFIAKHRGVCPRHGCLAQRQAGRAAPSLRKRPRKRVHLRLDG